MSNRSYSNVIPSFKELSIGFLCSVQNTLENLGDKKHQIVTLVPAKPRHKPMLSVICPIIFVPN